MVQHLLWMQDPGPKQEKILAIAGSNPANIELFIISEQVLMRLPDSLRECTAHPGLSSEAGSGSRSADNSGV